MTKIFSLSENDSLSASPQEQKNTICENRSGKILLLLFFASLLYFFANFQRTVVPGAIFSDLQSDLKCSAAGITAMGALFMYVYAASQLFSGVLVDKYGGNRLMTFGGFIFTCGAILFPLGSTLTLLYISRIITGIGASTIYLSVIKETKRSFPNNFGPVMGLAMLIGYAGSMAANAPFVSFIQMEGLSWRKGLLFAGIILGILWFIFSCIRFAAKMPPVENSSFRLSAFAPAVRKHNLPLYMLVGLSFAIFYCLQTVAGKKFLEDYCHIPSISAGWVLTLTGAFSAFASFFSPIFSKLAGNRRRPFMLLMGAGTLFATLGPLLALCFHFSAPWFFAGTFFLLALTANMTPVFLSIISETNPLKALGACASFSNFFAYMLVALLGTLSGILIDLFPPQIIDGIKVYGRNSYISLYLFLTVLAFIGFFCSLTIKETYGKGYTEKS